MTTLGAAYGTKRHTIAVVGKGPAAGAVTNALSALPGVGCVRQMAMFEVTKAGEMLRGVDHVVEMVGGVSPAFALAMATLSGGMAFTTANPLLVAAHGRTMQNAARGQQGYFGFQGAGFGLPVAELMGATRPTKLTVSFVTVASMAVARMVFRNESLAHVSAHMKMQGMDLSDWGGKLTQARAMALRGLWFENEVRGSQLTRVSVEMCEPEDVKRLRSFGLQPVYGAEITEEGIYTGPLAVANGSPLLNATVQDVLVAETDHGDMVLAHTASEEQRVVAGIVADVRAYLRPSRPALGGMVKNFGIQTAQEPLRAYVRMPYAARDVVLAGKPEILSEKVEADGLWQAVVAVQDRASLQIGALGGVVYPVSGEWEPPVAGSVGLRMVG